MKAWFGAVLFYGLATSCAAQVRWCPIAGSNAANKLLYPPIARAAHLTGTVIERVIFVPGGRITGVEIVMGPFLLAKSTTNQLLTWNLVSNASGVEPCQALVVVDFAFGDSHPSPVGNADATIYRLSVREISPPPLDAMYSVSGRR